MTDWDRVEKLRSQGADWEEIALDRRVGFHVPTGTNPGRALKALHFRRRSRASSKPERVGSKSAGIEHAIGHRQAVALIAILAVASLVVAYVVQVEPRSSAKPTGWVGRTAPDFTLASANSGGSFTLSSATVQTNVLLFFNEGLSCSPCLAQMQQLDSDSSQFQALNVQVVSITGDSLDSMMSWTQNSRVVHSEVLADPSLSVSNTYDTTSAAVSMMPGTAPGHTFILVGSNGVVLWRADYGPSDMSVPDSQILQAVQGALPH